MGTQTKQFKKITDAFSACARGELPPGTKLVIGATNTKLVKTTKNTQSVFFTFEGTPAQFAKLLLTKAPTIPSNLKIEIEEPSKAAKSGDDE